MRPSAAESSALLHCAAVAAFVVLVAATSASASTRSDELTRSPVRTLKAVSERIDAFAQDGNRIAWTTGAGACVHLRNLSTRREAIFRTPRASACRPTRARDADTTVFLAIAGSHALWTVQRDFVSDDGDCAADRDLFTASPAQHRARVIEGDHTDYNPDGCMLPLPIAGDGDTLVYAADGRRVVQLKGGQTRPLSREGNVQVWALAASAGKITALERVFTPGPDSAPAWSPDGTRLAFARFDPLFWRWPYLTEHGSGAIYVTGAHGEGIRRLSQPWSPAYLERYQSDPVWSPDGGKIAFVEGGLDFDLNMFYRRGGVMDADGGAQRFIGGDADWSWSRGGRKIAYAVGSRVAVVDRDGGGRVTVLPCETVNCGSPRWTPQGDIVYARSGGEGAGVSVMSADGAAKRRLVDLPQGVFVRSVEVSPDGSRIACTATDNRGTVSQPGPLYVVNADGSDLTVLFDRFDTAVRWSPDGTSLAFNDKQVLKVMAPDGSHVRELATHAGGVPDWSPSGREIAFATSGMIAAVDVATGLVRQITRPAAGEPGFGILDAKSGDRVIPGATPPGDDGEPAAVALSRSFLTVFDRGLGTDKSWLEIWTAATGQIRNRIEVSPRLGWLSASGGRIVYSVGKTIVSVDTATGAKSMLARAVSTPIGLSIEGRRVAWAENVGGRGRVRAGYLPRGES